MTRPPSKPRSISAGKILAAVPLLAAAALYLAGYVFLWWIKADPYTATPLTAVRYWHHWGHLEHVAAKLNWSLGIGFGSVFGLFGIALLPRRRPLHGEARFATRMEVNKAGLLADNGILLGQLGSTYLTLGGQQGALIEAPPRAGKGVGFVVPNLLNWDGSVIVNDIKTENWTLTAGFRAAHGHQVHRFDPLAKDHRSARWNPLDYVGEQPAERIDDLQLISSYLFSEDGEKDKFWTSSARSLFIGIALYVFETPGVSRTLGEILRQGMSCDAEGFQKHWRRIIEHCDKAGIPLSPQALQTLLDAIDTAPQTASSIRKTFTSRLDLWLNPMVDAATSASDFDLRDLRKKRMSIYVCIAANDIPRLRPLVNLFWQQAIGEQTRELPEHNPALKHQLMLMMDEFAALGRLPVVAEATAFLPGYNVRPVIIVQSSSQLIEHYGPEGAKSLRKMLAVRVVFAIKEFDDAEAISKQLGTYTVRQKSHSRALFGMGSKSPSVSISDQMRRLMLPQEIMEMGAQRMILLYENLRPVLADRIAYHTDSVFKRRVLAAPPVRRLDVAAVQAALVAAQKAAAAADRARREEEKREKEEQQHDGAAGDAASGKPGKGGKARPGRPRARADGALDAPVTLLEDAPAMRPVQPADMDRLGTLKLTDFSMNFDAFEGVPKTDPLSDEEALAMAKAWLSNTEVGGRKTKAAARQPEMSVSEAD